MKFDEGRLSLVVDQPKCMDPETIHHAKTPWNCTIRHDPHDHMHGFRGQRDEIPKGIVCCGGLWHFMVCLRLEGVHQIWELHGILDKEHGNVVTYQIPYTFTGIKLRGKPPGITHRVGGASRSVDGREPHEDRSLNGRLLEHGGFGVACEGFVDLEITMCPRTASMHYPFRHTLMVELRHLFAKVKVLH